MKAYYHDNESGDRRLPHRSGDDLDPSVLSKLGILHFDFVPTDPSTFSKIDSLAATRKYVHRDQVIISPQTMGASYESNLQTFFNEHIHEDEEIRYILQGGGFFDVRDREDKWIRIRVEPGDLLVLPAGIYHRFTIDEADVRLGLAFAEGLWSNVSIRSMWKPFVCFKIRPSGPPYIGVQPRTPTQSVRHISLHFRFCAVRGFSLDPWDILMEVARPPSTYLLTAWACLVDLS